MRARVEVDLDGDGTPDPVRLQVDPVAPGQRKEVVTAELSAGPVRELRATRMGRGASGGLAPGGDLDRDGDEELLLEWREGRARFAAPIDLEGGELRLLRFSSERTPLARGLLDGRAYGYAVSDDGALTSWRSVAVLVHDGPDDEVPPTFRADVFTWGIASQQGERVLRAEPAGRACVDGLAGAPRGCAARTPVPRSGPR